MPYRRPGTLEVCWIVVKLWVMERLGLNGDDKIQDEPPALERRPPTGEKEGQHQ